MISGELFIGFSRVRTHESFQAVAAADGGALSPPFSIAGTAEVDRAGALAAAALDPYRSLEPEARARFLEAIADEIDFLGDALLQRAHLEDDVFVRLALSRTATHPTFALGLPRL